MIQTIVKIVNGDTNIPSYLNYIVTYSDDIAIADYHYLKSNTMETYKVRIEYKRDITSSNLPEVPQVLNILFDVNYVQANENAVVRPLRTFANDSWNMIIRSLQKGEMNYYHVGDTKTIDLGNDLGTHTLRIANTTTTSSCSSLSYSQTACGFVIEFEDIIMERRMNATQTNVGSWPSCEMRTYLNDADNPTSFYNSLPDALKNAIIDTRVISGHGSTSGESNYTSVDKIYLLDYVEIYGSNYTYDTLTLSQTRQLDYYKGIPVTSTSYSGAIKKLNGARSYWWLRSANSNYNNYYRRVGNDGTGVSTGISTSSYGLSPAFRLIE